MNIILALTAQLLWWWTYMSIYIYWIDTFAKQLLFAKGAAYRFVDEARIVLNNYMNGVLYSDAYKHV